MRYVELAGWIGLIAMNGVAQEKGKELPTTATDTETKKGSVKQLPPPPAIPSAVLEGSVKGPSGAPAPTAIVTLSGANRPNQRVTTVDKDGRYEFKEIRPDTYNIRFEAPDLVTADAIGITLSANDHIQRDVVLTTGGEPVVTPQRVNNPSFWAGIIAVLVYLLSILVTRWYKIAVPSRNFLRGQISATRSRLQNEVSPDPAFRTNIDNLTQELKQIETNYLETNWCQYIFWSQSKENAAWVAVHEIERELAAYLSPDELVRAHLIVASPKLRLLAANAAKALADQIDHELGAQNADNGFRRRLLAEATAMLYEDRDTNFTTLMDWQNKAMWLILATCLLIVVLGALASNVMLFFAGAAGGLVSRLMRALQRQDVPIDYGASWTTLFLSPLFGAVSGWFGIALITLMANPAVGLLGRVFMLVKWGEPLKVSTMAIAFALGFSERLFSSLLDALEQQASKTSNAPGGSQAPKAPSAPPLPLQGRQGN